MELEEAKKELNRTITENNRLLDPRNEQFFNKKEKKEIEQQSNAIKTVLKTLDNSIPKEKVKKKIEELSKQIIAYRKKCKGIEYIISNELVIKILQKLLQE